VAGFAVGTADAAEWEARLERELWMGRAFRATAKKPLSHAVFSASIQNE